MILDEALEPKLTVFTERRLLECHVIEMGEKEIRSVNL
jgi:hypothetical protein